MTELPICPPRTYHEQDPNGILYQCGRSVVYRDPTNPAEACPGGMMVCGGCVDAFGEFMEHAYNARARRKEWKTK